MIRRAAALVALLAAAGCWLGAARAGAGSGVNVERQSWSFTSQVPDPALMPAEHGLYAAARAGSEEARSFIILSFSGLHRDEIAGLSLTLTEGTDGLRPETASLAACALADPLPADAQPGSSASPAANCAFRVAGVRNAPASGGPATWTFDLGVFIDPWFHGPNNGLVVFPDIQPGAAPSPVPGTDTYRVGFDATETLVTASLAPSAATDSNLFPSAGTVSATGSEDVLPAGPVAVVPGSNALVPAAPQAPPAAAAAPAASAGGAPRRVVFQLPRSANSPPTAAVLGGLLALMGGVLLLDRTGVFSAIGARRDAGGDTTRARARPGWWRWPAAAVAVVALPPLLFNDSLLFKWGYLLIFVTAAIGMHVLVNWSGQLSLAHAAMIGLPAFVVGKLSVDHAVSPVLLLPVALLVGAAIGVFVALPALRVRGFYITVITLAAGVAIEQLFFSRSWLIGPGALSVPRPTFGPIRFTTFAGLYPWMALLFVGTVAALRALYRSKVARAFFWIKADPDAAAAAGINASLYIILAYVIAGLLAGLAGGMTSIWVRQLTPSNFPLSLAFSYLIVAVLAGPGPITGVLATVFVLQGLPLFNRTAGTVLGYVTPLAVLVMLTRYPGGVNALGRRLSRSSWARRVRGLVPIPASRGGAVPQTATTAPSRTLIAGAVLIVAGFTAIGLSWYHTGNTDQVWIQVQELASGGIGGMALVIVGTGLVVRDQLARNAALVAGAAPSSAASLFPIADYDDLKVFEIAPLLSELYPEELLVVRRHEQATKGRAGILGRIDKLLAGGNGGDNGGGKGNGPSFDEPRLTVEVAAAR